jgi:hypothetical protein
MVELVHQHHIHIRTAEGVAYVPRTYAMRRSDGTWEAWLEFEPIDCDGPTLKTDRETCQVSREAVGSWASGLEPTYVTVAFARAHVISVG